jgi:hypothetical protein
MDDLAPRAASPLNVARVAGTAAVEIQRFTLRIKNLRFFQLPSPIAVRK